MVNPLQWTQLSSVLFFKIKAFMDFCLSLANISTPLHSLIFPPDLYVRETQMIFSGWQCWREACACPFNPVRDGVLYL
jgi:hypothetical protein